MRRRTKCSHYEWGIFWSRRIWVQIPSSATYCVASGKSFSLSGPQLPLVGLGTQVNSVFVVAGVQSLRCVRLFVTHAARQASLSFSISRSLLKFMSIELVMPSNLLILCRPLLLLPSIFPSIIYSKDHKRLCFCPWSSVRSWNELHVVKKKKQNLKPG